jgi:hypothetical protein
MVERGRAARPGARVLGYDGQAALPRPTPPSPRPGRCVPTSSREHRPFAPARSVVWVGRLLGRPVLGPEQQHLGHVRDVVATLPEVGTVVSGLIVDVGGHSWFAPAAAVQDLRSSTVVLRVFSTRSACRPHSAELLLAQDALGQLVMTAATGPTSRISDIALRRNPAGWTVWAADTRSTVQRLIGSSRGLVEWDVLAMRRLATLPMARTTVDGR